MTTQLEAPLSREEAQAAPQRCTCAHVRQASRHLIQLYDDVLRAGGVTSGQFVLLMAIHAQGSDTMGNIATMVQQEQSAFSRNLKLLESKGFVRTSVGSDRRTRWISLTPAGQERLQQAFPLWQRLQDRIEEKFGRERMHRLMGELEELQHLDLNGTAGINTL
jgi:DNA-binding MarR family transcriptional regulator